MITACFCGINNNLILDFITERTGTQRELMKPAITLGIWQNGTLIAGVAYSNYNQMPRGSFVELSVASDSPCWLNRHVLSVIFDYPFETLGVTRLQTLCHRKNKRARKLTVGLGFKQEGVARCAWDGKADAIIHSMTRKDWQNMVKKYSLYNNRAGADDEQVALACP